jgi:leucyl aminopeptidase
VKFKPKQNDLNLDFNIKLIDGQGAENNGIQISSSKSILLDQTTILVDTNETKNSEGLRKAGHSILGFLKNNKASSISVEGTLELVSPLVEGLLLSNYEYKYGNPKTALLDLNIHMDSGFLEDMKELATITKAVHFTRTLVNQPSNVLDAITFCEQTQEALPSSVKIEVLDEGQIQSLKMGGLLAVNQGSEIPPRFLILEYLPVSDQKPIVLVGKGVTYDTGGLSLKPTPHSMDIMKCDMGGGGAVVGAIKALADTEVKKNVVGLIPLTDNRLNASAVSPGDVITMFNGKTVEVMNTDAEGRLILGDALSFAAKYDPELTLDLATLTGSAVRAIGEYASVVVGTADEKEFKALEVSGQETFERVAQLPFWDDYDEELKSDIADLNNIGSDNAGAITAGKFLANFIKSPWIHIDIAGPSFNTKPKSYQGLGGNGYGVRLLHHFISNKA